MAFPFVELKWTKFDCISWALYNGIGKEEIAETVSCWHYQGIACGTCKQCFKRELIFKQFNIQDNYTIDPVESPYGKHLIKHYQEITNPNPDEREVNYNITRCIEKGIIH